MDNLRPDHRIIFDLVRPAATVLDLGCGRGELLLALTARKGVRGQGVEIDRAALGECVRSGINVLYGDLDEGLNGYQDGSFDYVILNNCLAEVGHPEKVLREALRVGRHVLVGFANFCHLTARLRVCLAGRAPRPGGRAHCWFNTPARRVLSVGDFGDLCRLVRARVRAARYLSGRRPVRFFPNLRADYALFLLEGAAPAPGSAPEPRGKPPFPPNGRET